MVKVNMNKYNFDDNKDDKQGRDPESFFEKHGKHIMPQAKNEKEFNDFVMQAVDKVIEQFRKKHGNSKLCEIEVNFIKDVGIEVRAKNY